MTQQWPPDYVAEFTKRQKRLIHLRANHELWRGAKEHYRTNPSAFINDWCITYDPRVSGTDRPATMPFITFERQNELVDFLLAMLKGQESGLIEKCRDMGATWVSCAFSVWLFLFWDGAAVGWGSRKEQLVDHIGDADSIFEKMRLIIGALPREFMPKGWSPKDHMTFMRFVNPENGSSITGEAGNNIGRGGRKLMYFKDESAHYERPEMIEAALGDNTNVQIDISSVNGLGNVFYRRRDAGVEWQPGTPATPGRTNVFVMDWSDHPAKDRSWYEARRKKAEDDGLLHVFEQEVNRNYSAAVSGIVIPSDWVVSCIDAHLKMPELESGPWVAALDPADGGIDRNALSLRKGSVLKDLDEWGGVDVGVTTRRAIDRLRPYGAMDVEYDCIGIGATVKAETNRLAETLGEDRKPLMPEGLKFVPWNAGAAVLNPKEHVIPGDYQTPINSNFYQNLKAQAWWQLRRRIYNTHRFVTEGIKSSPEEMISFDSKLPFLRQLQKELSQPTRGQSSNLKMLINKTPEGTRSPNLADSVVMNYWPCPDLGMFVDLPLSM